MGLFQFPIQNKLSALLGVQVTFEKFNVSLLSGTIEASGVVVAGPDASAPLLTVRRIKAEISIPRALKREIVIKSLAIERPVLSVVREADGRSNLPQRVEGLDPEPPGSAPLSSSSLSQEPAAGEAWDFQAQKVLLVGGEIHFRQVDERGHSHPLMVSPLAAELVQQDDGLGLTLIADHVGRPDGPDLGPLKLNGRLTGISNLRQVRSAGLDVQLHLGERLHGQLRSTAVASEALSFLLNGTIDLAQTLSLLQPLIRGSSFPETGGEINVSAEGTLDPRQGLRIAALQIQGKELTAVIAR